MLPQKNLSKNEINELMAKMVSKALTKLSWISLKQNQPAED